MRRNHKNHIGSPCRPVFAFPCEFFTIAKDCTERLSAAASEKNRELLQIDSVYRQRVLQTVTSLLVALLVFRAHDLLKITNINPQQEKQTFAIETISSPNIWGS